jgi:hypothetical protein
MLVKPRPLQILSVLCLTLGAGLALALILTPFDLPLYSVNGAEMKGRLFARLFAVPLAILALSLGVAGWAVIRNKRWSRSALLFAVAAFWGTGAWISTVSDDTIAIGGWVWRGGILVAISALLLYLPPGIRQYYETLNQDDRGA